MALTHKFVRTDFENNLKRATQANAVLLTDLASLLKDKGVFSATELPPRAQTAYQIVLPMVAEVGN